MIARRLLNENEAAEYIGRSVRALQALRLRRLIAFVKHGRRIQYDIQDLDAFIQRGKVPAVYGFKDAKRELRFCEGQIAEGKHPGPRIEKVTFDDLSTLVLDDYIINKKRTLTDMERYIKKLGEHFKGMPAVWVESDKIDSYIKSRLADGVANATINRELSALKRMFHLGARRTPPLVFTIPYIPHLEENNVRTGFLEYDDYKKLYAELPEYLRPALCIAYHTGARAGEILTITWDRVDLAEGAIHLDPKNTKSKEPRIVYLTGSFYEEIAKQKELRDSLYPECPYVVFNRGKRIKDCGQRGTRPASVRVSRDCSSMTYADRVVGI